jgi:DHA2 family multidrug resistance protein
MTTMAKPSGKWAILATVTFGSFISIMDGNIVGVAMPRMGGTFAVSLDALTWVAVTYLIAALATMAMSAWLSALMGRKRFYILSLVVFTLASVWCGMTRSLEMMILTRLVQGLAAGGMVPVAQSTILATFDVHKRGKAMGIYIMLVLVASAIGPIMGGWLTDSYGWPWIFYVNVPFGVVGVSLAMVILTDPPELQHTLRRIDGLGVALLLLSVVALQLVLARGEREDWFDSTFITVTTLVAVVGLALLIWWELRVEEPVINLRLFTNIPFVAGILLVFLFGIPFFGSPFLLPFFLQKLRGYPVLDSGVILLPQALTVLVLAPLAGRLYDRVDGRLLLGTGIALLMAGYFDMAHFNLQVGGIRMLPGLVLTGAGMAIMLTVLTTATISTVPVALMPMASSIFTLTRRFGGSVGYALVANQLDYRTAHHRAHLAEHITPFDPVTVQALKGLSSKFYGSGLPQTVSQHDALQVLDNTVNRNASMLAFNDLFWLLGIMFMIGIPCILLIGRRSQNMSKLVTKSVTEQSS